MSTLALKTSAEAPDSGRGIGTTLARYFDLVLLAVALPVFVVAGLPLLGYAAAAAAWLAQHVILFLAERHAAQALERGERNRAMGAIGFATLGRLWLVTGTILIVGLVGDREAGLAAAVLSVVLVTAHLAGLALTKLLEPGEGTRMSTGWKVLIGIVLYVFIIVVMVVVVGSSGENDEFQPQNEFLLEPWVPIDVAGIDLSINKAVLYLVLASVATIVTMTWISSRMQREPNKVQMLVELAYDLTRNNITGTNIEGEKLALKWFPFLAALFFWIWFSNMIGYLPLPTNTEHPIDVFGLEVPAFALYAATANLSIPLVLTLVVWIAYNVEGIREKGVIKYFASWLPPGLEDMNPIGKGLIFIIEVLSHLVRLISLSVRLFANILAGHLLILFMGGGLAVLLGLAALGIATFPLVFFFFIFEVVLVATLQAFIFSTLTAIYIGGATAESH